jgi:hypothetical protein
VRPKVLGGGKQEENVAYHWQPSRTFEGTQVWVGGTGRYQGVRGIERDHSLVEMVMGSQGKLEAKSQQSKHEVEYWFEK